MKRSRSDRKVAAREKGEVYKMVMTPAILYGLETVALTARQEVELGVTKIRKESIRGTAQVERFGHKVLEAKLRGFGHVH